LEKISKRPKPQIRIRKPSQQADLVKGLSFAQRLRAKFHLALKPKKEGERYLSVVRKGQTSRINPWAGKGS